MYKVQIQPEFDHETTDLELPVLPRVGDWISLRKYRNEDIQSVEVTQIEYIIDDQNKFEIIRVYVCTA